jgi:secretory lipase
MDLGSVAPLTGAEWIGQPQHEALQRGIRPQLPADDPFYDPPAGFQHSHPGTVLRSRDIELAFLGLIPQRITATQLLYRTTDMHGNPEAAATTVIVPAERGPEAVTPVVSYQCAIDAVSSRCFPSYALRRRAVAPGAVAQLEFLLIAAAMAEGWAVSVPDHEGRAGVWGAPYEPGYHVLDGLRAALNTERLGLSPSAPIGLWGYSGGGLASAWAAEMSGSYAPELNIVGAVLGSPVGDLGHTFRRLNGTYMSGLPALVVAALADIYSELNKVIQEHATEEGKELLKRLHNMTTAEAVIRMVKKDMDDMVDVPLEQILDTPDQARFRRHQAWCSGAHPVGADRPGGPRSADLRRRHRRTRRHLLDRRRECHLPPRHVQRAPAAAPDVGADDAALAHRPVRWQAGDRTPNADEVADVAEPDDLCRHGAAGEDRRQGGHWAGG